MATISQIVAQIRTAIFGRDVRENIAQGIEKCYTDVTSGTTILDTEIAKIEGLDAVASQLPSNQNPTATVSEVSGHKRISFGIPAGVTPNVTAGTTTTSEPGTNAAITRRSGSPDSAPVFDFVIPKGTPGDATIDDTAGSGDTTMVWSADKLTNDVVKPLNEKAEADNLYSYKTTSGNPVIVEDAVADAVKTMRIEIAPVQDLHGYDYPWPAGGGKNKLPFGFDDTAYGITFKVNDDGSISYSGTAGADDIIASGSSVTLPAGTYILNGANSVCRLRAGKGQSGMTYITTDAGSGVTIELTEETELHIRPRIQGQKGQTISGTIYPMVRLSSETDSTFAPYSNICPISGWTECNVTDTGKNLFDPSNFVADHYISSSGEIVESSGFRYSGLIQVETGKTYVVKGIKNVQGGQTKRLHGYNENGDWVKQISYYGISESGIVPFEFTGVIDSGIKYVRLSYAEADTNLMIADTTYGTEYEPFGTVSTIPFDQTIYGAELTINRDGTGRAVPKGDKHIWNGTENWNANSGNGYLLDLGDNNYLGLSLANMFKFVPPSTGTAINEGECCWHATYHGIFVVKPNMTEYDTVAKWKAFLAENNLEVYYEYATEPTPIPLTAPQVQLLTGYNTVYADTGAILSMLYPVEKYQTVEQSDRERIHIVDSTAEPVKTIPDGADGVPMGITFAVEPVQDLHGQSSPYPAGGGKNLFDINTYPLTQNQYINGNDGYSSSTQNPYACTVGFVPFSGHDGQQFTLNKRPGGVNTGIAFYSDATNGSFISGVINNGQPAGEPITFTVPNGTNYIRFTVPAGETEIQIESGSTATDYAPYSNICPISGWTEGKLTGTGKNLVDETKNTEGIFYNDDGSITQNNNVTCTEFVKVKPNATYTISGTNMHKTTPSGVDNVGLRFVYFDKDKNFLSRSEGVLSGNTLTGTTPSNCCFIRSTYGKVGTSVQLGKGSTATAYQPFGSTYTIQFGETVYGGTLTVNKDGTGSINVDKVIETIPTITSLNTSAGGIKYAYFTTQHTIEYHVNDGIRVKCENFKSCTYETRGEPFTAYLGGPNQVVIFFDTDTTIEQANAYVNGSKILLYLIGKWSDHSTTLPITAPQVKSLLGANNLFADTGDILSVDYSADTKLYVDKLFASLTNATGVSF